MRRMRPVETKKPGEFRLLMHIGLNTGRTREEAQDFAARLNLQRLEKHVDRLQHRLYSDVALRKIKLQNRRRSRAVLLSQTLA